MMAHKRLEGFPPDETRLQRPVSRDLFCRDLFSNEKVPQYTP